MQVRSSRHLRWDAALGWAIPIALFVLGLFYYWFAIADRYAIFLYGHTATGIPLTQPFDEMTSSRYWMCGLVASGLVTLIYTALNWALGRAVRAARRLLTATLPRRQTFSPSTSACRYWFSRSQWDWQWV